MPRALSAYNIFMKRELAAIKKANPKMDHRAAFTAEAKMWSEQGKAGGSGAQSGFSVSQCCSSTWLNFCPQSHSRFDTAHGSGSGGLSSV